MRGDSIIDTFIPVNQSAASNFLVNKVPLGNGVYALQRSEFYSPLSVCSKRRPIRQLPRILALHMKAPPDSLCSQSGRPW